MNMQTAPTRTVKPLKYKKKPVEIEAIVFDGKNSDIIIKWSDNKVHKGYEVLLIDTLEGQMTASVGDYIIKGINGEFYPCKPDIFVKTYDLSNN